MKKLSCVAVLALTAALATGAAFAAAPANMLIANNTGYFTNAYIHNVPVEPLGPHNSQFIPWTGPNSVTALCHGSSSMLKDADPCAFEVYLTDDPSNPQQKPTILFDRSSEDKYSDPGNFDYKKNL